jgi:multicomponent Na+:H+ antiporter subunit F
MILSFATLAILTVMGIALMRAFLGPTLPDRILAVNMFGTKTVLLICITALVTDAGFLLDVAMVYALINFIGVIGALQYFERSAENGINE